MIQLSGSIPAREATAPGAVVSDETVGVAGDVDRKRMPWVGGVKEIDRAEDMGLPNIPVGSLGARHKVALDANHAAAGCSQAISDNVRSQEVIHRLSDRSQYRCCRHC